MVKVPFVRADLGVEPHLEQDVAQLLGQVPAVALVDGVDGLVALLDDVAPECFVRLRLVPGAAVGAAQLLDDGEKGVEAVEVLRIRS